MTGEDSTLPMSPPATPPPTIQGFDTVSGTLSQITPLSLLVDPETPQYAAASWILLEDDFDVDFENAPKLLQRYALATVYFATNGPDWARQLGFLTGQDECLWQENLESGVLGVTCDQQGFADLLVLGRNGLQGTIPGEIAGLPNLLQLDMSQNTEIVGTVPQGIGTLHHLTEIDLSQNELSGQLPTTLGALRKLVDMHFYDNNLSGPLPSTIGNLVKLHNLQLDTNQLTGSIPSQVSKLTSLLLVTMNGNSFTDGMENFCAITGGNRFGFYSDCRGPEAEVECSCCTYCCADLAGTQECIPISS